MLFDKLCYIVENFQPKFCSIINTAKLFEIPVIDDATMAIAAKNLAANSHLFILPFEHVAIESENVCIILSDFVEPHEKRDDSFCGLSIERGFQIIQESSSKNIFNYIIGSIKIENQDKLLTIAVARAFQYDQQSENLYLFDNKKFNEVDLNKIIEIIGYYIARAMMKIFYFNNPNVYIVESRNIKKRNPINEKTKIYRSYNRPIYIYMEKIKIFDLMGINEEIKSVRCHKTPEPHRRRAHLRTFKHPRFIYKLGQTITIRDAWVGPSEIIVNNRYYRVVLNCQEQ